MGSIAKGIEIDVFAGNGCDQHRVGEKFRNPEDIGKICPRLTDSSTIMMRVLQFGGTPLPWTCARTVFIKEIGPDGRSTEFVRGPDSTDGGIVARIRCRRRESPREIGRA